MEYTAEQRLAVFTRGRNLLISAAAGSGKTRVLVDRVTERIRAEGLALSDFLIITFTRAAAAELRDRIAAELSRLAAEEPDNRNLRRQLALCGSAEIMTIDAFCSALVREFSHLCDLPPAFRIAEGAELEPVQEEAMAAALERIYTEAETDPTLRAFVDSLSRGRFDSKIEEAVTILHRAMYAAPFPEEWAARAAALYDAEKFADTAYCTALTETARSTLRAARSTVARGLELLAEEPVLAAKYAVTFSADLDLCLQLEAALDEGWDAAREVLAAEPQKLATAPRNYGDPAFRDRLKAMRDRFKKSWAGLRDTFAASLDELTDELHDQRPAVRGGLRAALIFSEELRRMKFARGIVDFSDLSHASAALLTLPDGAGGHRPSEVAEEVGARYAEVLVDEFQDTNSLQTLICEALTAGRNSLFLVGDVKQSIYRFRLAEPELFLERFRRFPPLEQAAEGEPARIILSRNFRSSAAVVGAVNYIFSQLMRGGVAQIDYSDSGTLVCGRNEPFRPEDTAEVHLLSCAAGDDDTEPPDALTLEAEFVADRISELLKSCTVPDGAGGRRALRPGDIAVLMRSATGRIGAFERAITARGIPAYSGGNAVLTAELRAMTCLLESISNPYLDIPLLAVLASPVFGFTPDELAAIRCEGRKVPVYTALRRHAEHDAHAAGFLATLSALREAAGRMTIDRLVLHIYSVTGIAGIYGAMRDGERRRAALDRLYEAARSYESASPFGLAGFTETLRRSFADGSFFAAAGGSPDCVQLMTVHRSKGLEYPVVFLCGLGRKFNFDDTRGDLLTHPDLGTAMKYPGPDRRYVYSSGPWLALSGRLREDTIAEELRILYVALTRAKEKLILVSSLPNPEKRLPTLLQSEPGDSLLRKATSFLDLLVPVLARHPDGRPLRERAGDTAVSVEHDAEGHFLLQLTEVAPQEGADAPGDQRPAAAIEPPSDALKAETARLLAYTYPWQALSLIPSKLTATGLKGRAKDSEAGEEAEHTPGLSPSGEDAPASPTERRSAPLRRPRFLSRSEALTPAERGTALHLAMQFVAYGACTTPEDARREIDSLAARGILDTAQAKAADAEKIAAFCASSLCRRAMASTEMRREFKFSLLDEAGRYYPDLPPGEQVLLQGVCDLFFVEDGKIILVDFKSDRVSPGGEAIRAGHYQPQLACYGRALERIFGLPVAEKLLWFFETGRCVSVV